MGGSISKRVGVGMSLAAVLGLGLSTASAAAVSRVGADGAVAATSGASYGGSTAYAVGGAYRVGTAYRAGAPAQDPIGGPRMGETGIVLGLPPGVPAPPIFPAGCYLVADLDSGAVILAKCPHTKGLPASTIKALTALALVDELSPADVVVATAEDADQEGSKVGLVVGSGYTVEQLFLGMLLTSGNDAAWALARHRGAGEAIDAMNRTAEHLGAHDTHAVNPSGLDAPDQVTSAYDLALIGRAVVRNERLAGYVKTMRVPFPDARVPGGGARGNYQISNHNRMLPNYPGTIGVKNGYTVAAKRTFVGAARRGDAGYVITYLNSATADWRSTGKLLDWAFAYGKQVRPVGQLVEPGSPQARPSSQGGGADDGPGGGEPAGVPALPGHESAQQASGTGASAAAGTGTSALGWLAQHPDVLLFAGGALGVFAGGLAISARTRRGG